MSGLFIVMVGLPARGKSTVASKLREGLESEGLRVEIFNNGELRRERLGQDSSAPSFYEPGNEEGRMRREELARINIRRALAFLHAGGDVAVLDATNASRARRAMIEESARGLPTLFVECFNDDPDLLEASVQRKTRLPEFAGLTPEAAAESFNRRIEYYRRIYVPLGEESCFLRVDTLNNRIVEERLGYRVPHYIRIRDILVSDWVRNLYLVRHGETVYNVEGRIGGDAPLTEKGLAQANALGRHFSNMVIPYIFTSTRQRSAQTAAPVLAGQERQGFAATRMALTEFDEINAGVCEGMRYDEIRSRMPEIFDARARDKYNYVYPRGEGYSTLKARVDRGLKKALFLSGNAPAIMIVGHQAINRMILSHFLFRRTEDVPYIYIPQDQYFHIVSTQKKKLFELVRFTGQTA
ncbi:Phosphoglycerate mutase [Oleidesulfovibrio alaskensis G20]|jgi:broad specificity phosphatase PhoE/predicted kinase|uniref:Phosphoglycerate mutase n=1 Tax=Oleidesulfovibrio alaskensis (strain ATCC BAA-1058 / DSM 17464 / G20) TaxID=207559 RepID=Q315T4_OLEA2|nr:6-phosphofructo-2-kinase/fructose-2,6-bisphosphatase [Oleidesulfovibrio alaskensis]ABB37312.1 Phosphoglycerate mutase [Oleidesulfovibrio alaskensis G20]MBG0773219.1 histidine phosphatase family protein [Oleidesulfovibrio alaskensis]MBL3583090.1 histidine phosphatase family protein [Oleidesulfovibrio alaskensis]